MMSELPPFWDQMTPQHQYEYSVNPTMRGPLTQLYSSGQYFIDRLPKGGLLEGETPLPENYRNLNEGPLWYQFPADQSLLEYGTMRGDGLSSEQGYHGALDYPKHAPRTPEHEQMYNLLRFNAMGGGI